MIRSLFSMRPRPRLAAVVGLLILVGVVALAALALPAMAQEPTRVVTDDDVNAIAKQLYCPICESTPLDVCATQACADWREVIRTKLSQGQTSDEIKAYFADQYGARALAEPPREGFPLLVWVLSILAVVIGGFLFIRYISRIRAAAVEGPEVEMEDGPAPEPAKDDYVARIEQELQER
jgi:cytochrome c-type biogenesis protein CcmH